MKLKKKMEAAGGTTSWLDAVQVVGPIDVETIAADPQAFKEVTSLVQVYIRSKRQRRDIVSGLITGGYGKISECPVCQLSRTCEECKSAEANRLHQSEMKATKIVSGRPKWRGYFVRGKFEPGIHGARISKISRLSKSETDENGDRNQLLVYADGNTDIVFRARSIPSLVDPSSQDFHANYPVIALVRPTTVDQVREIIERLSRADAGE